MATNFANRALARTHQIARQLPESKHLREDRLRRRAGTAWARMKADGSVLGLAIGVHRSTIARRKTGEQGWLSSGLIDIAALEANNIDTMPMIEAMIETRLEARSRKVDACLEQLSEKEQELDGAENVAQIHYHRTRDPRPWARAYLAKFTFAAAELLPAMMRER